MYGSTQIIKLGSLARSLAFLYSPEDDDVFEEGEEDEDDAGAHPDVQRRDVAHPRRALPAKTTQVKTTKN